MFVLEGDNGKQVPYLGVSCKFEQRRNEDVALKLNIQQLGRVHEETIDQLLQCGYHVSVRRIFACEQIVADLLKLWHGDR